MGGTDLVTSEKKLLSGYCSKYKANDMEELGKAIVYTGHHLQTVLHTKGSLHSGECTSIYNLQLMKKIEVRIDHRERFCSILKLMKSKT